MAEPLRVLLLEDSGEDALLVTRAMRQAQPDCQVQCVDAREPFLAALEEYRPDLILSDHRLRHFSGMHALEAVRAIAPDTPFIFVTGSLDEETAIECVKAGAWDYVLKDRLVRLAPAVAAALDLRATRQALARSEEQLRQNQKMEALGRLAGGVAHDYNNLMMVVLGYSYVLAQTLDSEAHLSDVEEIRKAAERAAGLTRQLLSFSRMQIIEPTNVNLNDMVNDMDRMLRTLLGEQVALVLELGDDLPAVRSDIGQLEQVVVNLAVNARDAMPNGGTLTIRTSQTTETETSDSSMAATHVQLTVCDTGTGIDRETLGRVFEPFFTTKPRGRGTGLGLATVYGIVRRCGGDISIATEVGVGTQFTVDFPATSEVASTAPTHIKAPLSLAGTEVLLIVEDEPAIRALARRVLKGYGYRVLEAETTRAALQIDRQEARIDLLISDLVVGDGVGVDLAQAMRVRRPDLSVLYISGYPDEEIARQGAERLDAPLLAKPFSPTQLVQRVRELLDERGTPRDARDPLVAHG